jgi:3-hydroxyacyl-CoA dehydrogenase
MGVVDLEKRGNVGLILVDNLPVNAISREVRAGIIDRIIQIQEDPEIKAGILGARGRTFMAGADIKEFGLPPKEPGLPAVLEALDHTPKIIIAAMFGTALGAGLELAQACHYRIALKGAKLGQPEIKLGLIPGAGGTQRLPRLVGVKKALDMIVSGRPIGAEEALEAGLIDRLAEEDILEEALAFAGEIAGVHAALRRTSMLDLDLSDIEEGYFDAYRAKTARRTRGLVAQELAIEAVEAVTKMNFSDGLTNERRLFMKALYSKESEALRHLFFAERLVGRIPHLDPMIKQRDIETVGVVGGGTMGGGISMAFSNAGLPVTMLEVSEQAIGAAKDRMRTNYQGAIKRGILTKDEVEARLERIKGTTKYEDFGQADLIIEAVFERMDLKKEIFRELDRVAKPGAILATNTSYLDTNAIAAETGRPGDVLGLHFFSPANLMRLLEIVKAERTQPDVLLTAVKLAKRISKIGVVSGVCHGFIGNRMLQGYIREAGLLVLEGAEPQDIDKVIYDFGFAMGPFAVMDLAGLDIGHMLRRQFPADRFDENAYRLTDRLVEMERKGQKTGAGVYKYEEGSREPIVDPVTEGVLAEERKAAGFAQRRIGDEEILVRCLFPLVIEGAKILEENIAYRPGDIDVVWVNGYGFPIYKGGPMFWADRIGIPKIMDAIEIFSGTHGPRWWQAGRLLKVLEREGLGFEKYYQQKFPSIYQ